MNQQHRVHNLIILDESGSMEPIKKSIIQGFNELVQTIRGLEQQFPEQEHTISFVSFNGARQQIMHFMEPAGNLREIHGESYRPDDTTPLFDAMGFSIQKLDRALEGTTDYNVLVTIMTDGAENSSRFFQSAEIRALVEQMKGRGWTFTYIGTDHDIDEIADALSINNKMAFQKNDADIRDMFEKERGARARFSGKIRSKEDLQNDYFDKPW